MEDSIEIADTVYPRGGVITMGDRQGCVALLVQQGIQHQNGCTYVAIPHDQMLLAVVAPWFASLEDEEQRKLLSHLYERRETQFPRQPRPVEMDTAPTDFDLQYLQEKGWIWQPPEQGKTPCTALLYDDGLTVRTEQAVITIPKQAILEFCMWVVKQTEWLDPQGASYQAKEYAERLECIYCRRNLPHTEEQHDKQTDISSPIFYDDGISSDPIDGQY